MIVLVKKIECHLKSQLLDGLSSGMILPKENRRKHVQEAHIAQKE
jgi:hypothetical protein